MSFESIALIPEAMLLNGALAVRASRPHSSQETAPAVPCFTPGTLIYTPMGERPVEQLCLGDRVITRDNGIQRLRWIGRRDISRAELMHSPALRPILIKAGSLGKDLPERDIMVSPNHRMLSNTASAALYFGEREVLIEARDLDFRRGICAAETLGTSYLHLMFDNHEVVLANGAWSESFQADPRALAGIDDASRQELFTMFPTLSEHADEAAYPAARRTLERAETRLLAAND